MKTILVLCLIGLASANFNAKTNAMVDFYLKAANLLVNKHNLHRVNLGDKLVLGYDMKGTYLEDLGTLVARGDSRVVALNDSTLQASVQIGLSYMVFGAESFNSQPVNATNARFHIADNTLDLEYTVSFTESGDCSLVWNKFEFSSLDQVTMLSDQQQTGVDVSKYWQVVKDHVNQYFQSRPFQDALAKGNPCNPQESIPISLLSL